MPESFNAKLQSKYGIKAQNQIMGATNVKRQYTSSLSHSKGLSGSYAFPAYNRTNTSKELVGLKDNFVRTETSESRLIRRTSVAANQIKQRVLSTDIEIGVRNSIRNQSICENRKPIGVSTKGIKDIREAKTAQEVREIMSQVNHRYKNGFKNGPEFL